MKYIFYIILVFATTIVQAQNNQPIFNEMPGMVSYTYRHSFEKDVAATLDTLQQMGIKDMEFSNLFGMSASEIRKMLDERGMYCSSYGIGYKDLVEKIEEVAENAKTLGASFVRVAWIPHDAPFDLDDANKAIEDFNKAGKELKDKHDITFCYHNHGYEFHPHQDGTLFDHIVQNTDPEYVSFEMDILWVHFPGADPVALLEKYPNRFKLMHLKDLKKGVEGDLSGGTSVENNVALGEGQLDMPAILRAAKKANVQHYYIEDESSQYYKQVPRSIEYFRNVKK